MSSDSGAHPNPALGRRRWGALGRSQAGFSLVESLVSVVILAVVGAAIFAALATVLRSDADQQARSAILVASKNYGDALAGAPYVSCATVDDYAPASVGLDAQANSTVSVTAVRYWNKSAPPTASDAADSAWSSAFSSSCGTDNGLQRITYKVTSSVGGHTVTKSFGVLKRFTGAYAEPEPDPPIGGRACEISNPLRVSSTWVNETLGQRGTNYSTGKYRSEMNILYLAGTRRFSYLRFDIAPGVACDNGGTLPTGANILAAQVRLYTFNIGGAPACGANSCWHVMERVRSTWDQSTLTWNNQPCPTDYGTSCQSGDPANSILFEHGTGALNWSPRFQRVQSPQLLADVKSFYASPGTNYGWVIKEACAETYNRACGSATPGFQMRSSRASDVSERPTLTVWY